MKRFAFVVLSLAPAAVFTDGASAASEPVPSPTCSEAVYKQFDFMVGSWKAGPTGQAVRAAKSTWTKLGPCAILEHWMPKGGGDGFSFNYYDQADKHWHQHWIDATGDATDYVGNWNGSKLVFTSDDITTPQMKAVKLTMTFEPLKNGSVRQSGTQSGDGGKSYQSAFDFTYDPQKP